MIAAFAAAGTNSARRRAKAPSPAALRSRISDHPFGMVMPHIRPVQTDQGGMVRLVSTDRRLTFAGT